MAAAKKSASKSSRASGGRTYSPGAGKSVERAVHLEKLGSLRSGKQGRGGKVKSREQAIAIGLSEARAQGEKVPPPPKGSAAAKRTGPAAKRPAAKKPQSAAKKQPAAKRAGAKKSATAKNTSKRATAKRVTAKRAR